jgi:hypothetical protein
MNLKEFINHRHICPFCDFPLNLSFHSKKWQNIKYEDDRLVIMFRMDGLKRNQKDFKVTYSFGLNDNSWFINFFSKEEKLIEEAPNYLRERFREMNKNLSLYRFYKSCANCNKFNYSSNYFDLNFKTANLGKLEIVWEDFRFFKPNPNGGYKGYQLINKPNLNETVICYGACSTNDFPPNYPMGFQDITIPLIKFTSKDETLERIQKLIVFS